MDDESPSISARLRDVPSLRSYACQAMACTFNFHLIGSDPGLTDSAVMEAEERLAQLEKQLSLYVEHSDTTRINRAGVGETIRISQDTVDCLLVAFDASARLGGKFHPFLGREAIERKGQRKEIAHLPVLEPETDSATDDSPIIGLDRETNTIQKLRTGPLLDLGGIGKGFALDQLRSLFTAWEIDQGLLECGGSAYLALRPPDGLAGWELSIGYEEQIETVALSAGQSIASSGLAFQGSHVVDPEAGPGDSEWKRSYASTSSGALADAASTAALLLQPARLSSIVEAEPELSFALFSEGKSFRCGPFFPASSPQ